MFPCFSADRFCGMWKQVSAASEWPLRFEVTSDGSGGLAWRFAALPKGNAAGTMTSQQVRRNSHRNDVNTWEEITEAEDGTVLNRTVRQLSEDHNVITVTIERLGKRERPQIFRRVPAAGRNADPFVGTWESDVTNGLDQTGGSVAVDCDRKTLRRMETHSLRTQELIIDGPPVEDQYGSRRGKTTRQLQRIDEGSLVLTVRPPASGASALIETFEVTKDGKQLKSWSKYLGEDGTEILTTQPRIFRIYERSSGSSGSVPVLPE
jgi:hypothetical protein